MLEQAAAATWKVDVGEVQAQLHEVVHKPTSRKLGYGELAAAAAGLPVPAADKVKLKDASAFRYIGKGNVRIADIVDITTGKAIYGQDVMLPGMKFAVIARPPVVGGKVASRRLQRGHEGAGRGEDRDAAAARRRPTSSGRSAASPSSPRTPGRRSRAARRSRSPGTTAPTRRTTPRPIARSSKRP